MIPIAKPNFDEKEVAAVKEAILSGWVSQGPKVKEFEKQFAAFVGASHACAVTNCASALHLALLAVGVKPKDIIVTVSHSFIATANAISYCGAKPAFVDIEPDTFNMSPEALKQYLAGSREKIAAVLVVHQIGMPADLKNILPIAKKYNIPVIEDAACAAGSEISLDGKNFERIGKPHGDIACFSFHPRKVLSTGEGGMITTNNADYDHECRLLRSQAMSVSDLDRHGSDKIVAESYPKVGYNYRMTDIQAAVGLEQLKKLPSFVARRRDIAEKYKKALANLSWLTLPTEPEYCKTNWQSFAVRLKTGAPRAQKDFMQYLLDNGVATRFGIMNAHQEAAYKNVGGDLPVSEEVRSDAILLPIYSALADNEQEKIIELIQNA